MRFQFDSRISKGDAFIACILTFAFGAGLAILVLAGSEIPLRCFDGGNAADWLAAVGTWAVGLAAFLLAASDRRLKLRERREQKMLRLKLDIAGVRNVASIADGLAYKIRRAGGFLQSMDMEVMSLASAQAAMDEIRASVTGGIWSADDKAIADDIGARRMELAEAEAGDLDSMISYAIKYFMSRPGNRPAADLKGLIIDVAARARQMSERLDAVEAEMRVQQQSLIEDRDRLAQRMNEEFRELL